MADGSLRSVRITAVPARHGPRFSLPIVGKVLGFVVETEGENHLHFRRHCLLFRRCRSRAPDSNQRQRSFILAAWASVT